VFFNHLGVPSIDVTFDGPYGVYHSAYDSHAWMRRFGDPGFEQHAAMVRLWGVMALRLANADVLPFDYGVYGRDIVAYLEDLEAVATARGVRLDLSGVRRAAQALAGVGDAPVPTDPREAGARNRALLQAERDLLTPDGIPGRPFFRHLVYAPLPSYAAQTLPGVREAVMEGDAGRAQAQAGLLAAALERAVRTLHGEARAQ
jgi:N-acetylated-alpha-linked acidic dipeptidase